MLIEELVKIQDCIHDVLVGELATIKHSIFGISCNILHRDSGKMKAALTLFAVHIILLVSLIEEGMLLQV
jgi:hypothetical protein